MSVLVGVGPQVNKFEPVSSDGHQMLLAGSEAETRAGARAGGPMSDV